MKADTPLQEQKGMPQPLEEYVQHTHITNNYSNPDMNYSSKELLQINEKCTRPETTKLHWTESASLPVFINKMLLECNHTHLFQLHIAYSCFPSTQIELSSCNRGHLAHKPKIFTTWPLTEKVWKPLDRANKYKSR